MRYSTGPGKLVHLGDALMGNVRRTLAFEAGAVVRGCSQIRTCQVHVPVSGNDPFLSPSPFLLRPVFIRSPTPFAVTSVFQLIDLGDDANFS